MALGRTVAILIIGLIVGAGASYGALTASQLSTSSAKTYTLGVVFPLTGTLASFGKSFVNAVNLAVKQMNANLSAAGNPIQFATKVADDAGTPAGALSAVQSIFTSTSAQIMIGPLTTAEVLGVRDYADTNHILILPPASSGTAAALPNDYIIRPGQPGDKFEGSALGQVIVQEGMKNIVYIHRADTSQQGTYNISSTVMKNAGLNVVEIVYDPTQSDFTAQVSTASTDVVNMATSSGGSWNTTGVVLGGFGTEAAFYFSHSTNDPNLNKVRWFGIEALNDNALLSDPVTGSFMAHVNLTITTLFTQNSPQGQSFENNFKAVYGSPPEPFSNYAYDITWIAMLTVLDAGTYSGPALLKIVPTVADHYFGAIGTGTYLDANGDQAIAFFAVDKCVLVAGTPQFTQIGLYNGGVNQVTLNSK